MEITLWEMSLVNQINFIPEDGEYIGLGMIAGAYPDLH